MVCDKRLPNIHGRLIGILRVYRTDVDGELIEIVHSRYFSADQFEVC